MQNDLLERFPVMDISRTPLHVRHLSQVRLEAYPDVGLQEETDRQRLPVPDHATRHCSRKRKLLQKLLRGLLDGAARPGLAFHEVRGLERHLGDGSHATEGSSRLQDCFVIWSVNKQIYSLPMSVFDGVNINEVTILNFFVSISIILK